MPDKFRIGWRGSIGYTTIYREILKEEFLIPLAMTAHALGEFHTFRKGFLYEVLERVLRRLFFLPSYPSR